MRANTRIETAPRTSGKHAQEDKPARNREFVPLFTRCYRYRPCFRQLFASALHAAKREQIRPN